VRANGGGILPHRPPTFQEIAKAVTDFLEIVKPLIQLVGLSPDKLADLGTWRVARPLDPDDLANLNEREPQPLRPTDELEQSHCLDIVCAVACRRSPCRGQYSGRFVEAERLSCCSATRCEVADEQAVSAHDRSVNPALGVKVKSLPSSADLPGAIGCRRLRMTVDAGSCQSAAARRGTLRPLIAKEGIEALRGETCCQH
jgi:hypothetical protein